MVAFIVFSSSAIYFLRRRGCLVMGSGFGFRQSWLRRETLAIPEHLIIANILPSTALQRSLPPRLRTLKRCPVLWAAGRSFGVAGFIAASSRKFMRFGLEIPG